MPISLKKRKREYKQPLSKFFYLDPFEEKLGTILSIYAPTRPEQIKPYKITHQTIYNQTSCKQISSLILHSPQKAKPQISLPYQIN